MGRVFDYFRRHRKAVFVLAVLIVISGTVTYIKTKKQSALEQASFAIADPKARQEQLKKLQQDTDNDNLRDWEEMLYHSDPQKSDTDGDGTPDGEEVKLGRDPVLAGPNDLMATSTPLQDSGTGQPQNLTKQFAEKIAKELIVRRMANPDAQFDADTEAQNLVDAALGSTLSEIRGSLTEKDIVIGRDDSKAASQAYQTAMLRIIETNAKSLTQKPYVQIFTEAMETQNYEKLNALDPYLTEYNHIIADLKKLSVPPRFAKLHLEYVNIIIEQANIAQKMRNAGSDPLSGLVALQQYTTLQERFKTLLNKFTAEYQKIGI